MRATATPTSNRQGKGRLLESCAIAAGLIALAFGGPALAQVNGVHVPTPGVTVEPNPGGNTTTVNVTAPETIINWIPNDSAPTGGAIDFLPAGESWNFSGSGDYTVLNRFVNSGGGSLSREIALNGTINSFDTNPSAGQTGNIWFYNAGGVLIGSTGVINVGSLVLTTNDIDTTGGLFGPDRTIRFRGATGTSAVTVNGTINANTTFNPGSSYVALVAPRVVQAGNVRVDGSAAYVAAEQADIRIGNVSGLFDINVTVGAEGGNVITHTGTTTGPAHQQGDSDQNRIYMVAIPKNDAITMLISGAIGYDDALSAQTDPDGAVRLSAGYNITEGEQNFLPVNGTAANIIVNDTLFRSNTVAIASGTFAAEALQQMPASPSPLSSAGQIFVEGDAVFSGDAGASLNIGAGQQGGATGNLTISSSGAAGTAGNVAVNVSGGTLSTGNLFQITSVSQAATATGDGVGGNASLTITGGSVISPVISISASAVANIGTNGLAGNARGGNASISVSNAGSTLSTNVVSIDASAFGPSNISVPVGGNAQGGTAVLTVANGANFSASNNVSLSANGSGGFGPLQSGNGTGGTARIDISGTNTSFTLPNTSLVARGNGGGSSGPMDAQNGGDGTGGRAELIIDVNSSATASLGLLTMDASGLGGDASNGENVVGGDARGGTATLTVAGGVTLQANQLALNADAQGGAGFSLSGTTGQSGNARGGDAILSAANGSTLTANGNIDLSVAAQGSLGENFGSGTGGLVTVSATSGGAISTASAIDVQARGGSTSASIAQSAGSGTGGNVDFIADGGTISADNFRVDASASVVNVSDTSGAALGGNINLTASNSGQISGTGSFGSSFDASAMTGVSATGSAATGGSISLIANAGAITLPADNSLSAGGLSGGATAPGAGIIAGTGGSILVRTVADASNSSAISFGELTAFANGESQIIAEVPPGTFPDPAGNGQGGMITIDIQGGSLTGGAIRLSADGEGGATGTSTGRGGTATFTQTGGEISITDLTVSANGLGDAAAGQSGDGIGGTATINLLGGTITAADISASADGIGGFGLSGNDFDPLNPVAGGRGGAGQGGTATITIDGSAEVNASAIGASAIGAGGAGGDFLSFSSTGGTPGVTGDGGNGTGGTATINLISGTVSSGNMVADATGVGGNGGNANFFGMTAATGIGTGGQGGNGQGGTATVSLAAAANVTDLTASIARGVGGDGGAHNVGGNGGNATGGTAQAVVNNFDAGALPVTLDAGAQGGVGGDGRDGNGGNGGNAVGGTARARADGANGNVTMEQVSFIANATGGAGGRGGLSPFATLAVAPSGGLGGNGRGGTLEIGADNGATVTLLSSNVSAPVLLSSGGTGGDGGGGASNESAGGTGGAGGNAGTGQGGTILLRTNGGTITSNGTAVDIDASADSGAGGTGGGGAGAPGGAGTTTPTTGGRVVIEATTGQIILGDTNINASGDNAGRIELRAGGNISMASLNATATGITPPTNNDTGSATTGIFLSAAGGTIATTANMALTTDGSIGVYAQGTGAVRSGTGLAMNAGDQIDIRHDQRSGTAPTIDAGDELLISAGTSISGAAGSLFGSASTLSLTATGPNGTISVDRLDGTNIVINSTGAASVEHAEAGNDFTATAGSFRTGLNSIITGGDIVVSSPGAVDLGNSTAGGFVAVDGQSIAFNSIGAGGSVFLTASGTAPGAEGITGNIIASGGNVLLRSAGNITIATSVAADGGWVDPNGVTAEGNLFVDAAGNALLTGASAGRMVGVNAGQAATVNGGSAGEDLLILAGTTANLSDFTAGDDAEIRAPGAITAQNVTTTGASVSTRTLSYLSGSGFTIGSATDADSSIRTQGGATTLGNLNAFDDIIVASTAAVSATAPITAGRNIDIDGANGVTAGTVVSGGTTGLNSAGGAISVGSLTSAGPVNANGQSVQIGGSSGNLVFSQINAATGDAIVTNGGDIMLTSGTVAGRAALTSTNGAVGVAQLTANSADLSAGTDMTLGNVTATQGLTAEAGNLLTLTGAVTGSTMALTSADINIGTNGRAGTSGVTTTLQLTNGNAGRQTFIGGTGTRSGYHIDAGEMALLFGSDIRISGPVVPPSSSGVPVDADVIIDSFTMTGGNSSSNLGSNGSLTIETPGRARVIGNVQLSDLSDASSLNLFADTALEVIAGQGTVRLTGANNAPGGQLNMASNEIIVATLAAIADVRAATTTDAINTRLAESDGVTSDEGALFARGISADVGRGFYVQNSGAGTTFAERRGLTFGAGGLDVVTAGPTSGIVINGVQLGSSGQVTGFDTLAFLTISGATPSGTANNFDRRSTLNGCLIAFSGACTTISLDPETNFPVQDVVDDPSEPDGEEAEGNNLPTPLITMRDIDPLTGEPLLDDPVTGAGNDDLWTPPAE